ncbi:fungal-specific transcription factor domain-containing protein [Nemania sp. NC0429]|nr:fungal-specific transcription factor domain-containing protein [Nemania sp. NC0429]
MATNTMSPSQGESSAGALVAVDRVAVDRVVVDSRPRPSASFRRDKPRLSCNHCRRRKSRCDRKQPCSNCSSRGQICTYAFEGLVDNRAPRQQPSQPTALTLRGRLDQLESLVVSLRAELVAEEAKLESPNSVPPRPSLSGKGSPPGAPFSAPADAGTNANTPEYDIPVDESSECGSMLIGPSELRYIGGEHWVAILDSIAELKGQVVAEEHSKEEEEPGETSPRALLLYGHRRLSSRAEIFEALPPKAAADRYISRYFNRLDLVSSAVHGPSFLREYEGFWEDSNSVSIIWVGLLYGMICLAVMVSDAHDSGHGPETDQRPLQIAMYREKIVQCLVMGEYTKPSPHVLEAVIHYVYVEFLLGPDAKEDLWFLLALEVNMAMRMGYHRDPSHFPELPPLQAEMRRRVWSTVMFSDVMISSQMGMPRMIFDGACDTAEPRNLNDADLNPEMAELPSPRPETEATTVLGLIARRRLMVALGAISDLASNTKSYSYAEVMRVDSVLREAEASAPPPLKMKPLAASMTDPPIIIMARLFLKHMYYMGQIMLHRKFLYVKLSSQTEDVFAYSRDACLDASLQVLQIQQILDEETRPGGQLDTLRWRMTSIMNHQFLTATMILCSLVHHERAQSRVQEMMAALRGARNIWMRSAGSQEARKAVETVNIVLARSNMGGKIAAIRRDRVEEDENRDGSDDMNIEESNDAMSAAGGGNADVVQLMPQESDMMLYEGERLMMQHFFPSIGQPDQQYGQNFAFNVNLWGNDYVALDSWTPMSGPESSNYSLS